MLGLNDVNDRKQLMDAFVGALATSAKDAEGMACSKPAMFVAVSRPICKSLGFAFSDNDLRECHRRLRMVVAKRLGATAHAINSG